MITFFHKNNFKKGFSLVELLVVMAIFLIIVGIVLTKQSKFSSDILITNLAYDVALTIRQAQVYGIGSKAVNVSTFRAGYGVHFDPIAAADSFFVFADSALGDTGVDDADFDYVYTAPPDGTDIIVNPITLNRGQKIHDLCVRSGGNTSCWSNDKSQDFQLDITFVKPNPDAHIRLNENLTEYDQAIIKVESSLGDKCRNVVVGSSGQISVEAIDPANPTGCL